MRTIAAATSLLLGLNVPLHAAIFNCQFLGGPTPLTCTVDSTKIAPCKQTISASLIALCQGGTNVPGTVNHLGCYYAVPEAEAALQKQAQSSPEAFANATDAVPGIRARAMEWLPNATAPGNNLGLLYSDGSANYITLCNVAKATTAARKRK